MEFIDLVPTLGKSSVSYSDLKFLSLPMSDYGVTTLTAKSLATFRKALEDDKDMALEYLTRKLGFDANDPDETQMAYAIYESKDLITSGKQKTGEYICQMHKSISPSEFDDCCASANNEKGVCEASNTKERNKPTIRLLKIIFRPPKPRMEDPSEDDFAERGFPM